MNSRLGLTLLALLAALAGCDPVPVQYPPGSLQYPKINNPNSAPSPPPPQPQVTGSQRLEHVWNKAMEGGMMGLHIGGPFGGAGGFTLGLLAGILTADSYYGELNARIQYGRA